MTAKSPFTDVYLLATEALEAPSEETLREAFEDEDVTFEYQPEGLLFAVSADESRVEVGYELRDTPLGEVPELLQGTPESRHVLEVARGFYRVRFVAGKPQASVAVFEALWTVRTLLELVPGVVLDSTAFKLHTPQDIEEITELDFDIRDHVTIHATEMREGDTDAIWVHSHGMSKFAAPDVEMFSVREEDLPAAETFFHELCIDIAFGTGPSPRIPISTSVGLSFQLLPSEEGRATLYGVEPELFEGHSGDVLTVVGTEGKHSMGEILEHYRARFEEETEEEAQAQQALATRMLPAFKSRFGRKGLMEPLSFLIRAPFEVHPEGEDDEVANEQLWVEVIQWDEKNLVGKLVDGGQLTTEWRKGAHVEIDDDQINALSVTRDGRALEPEEMQRLLVAERPS